MQKRGQLGIIEMKFAIYGFIVGILGSFVLIFLGTNKMISFQVPVVCGFIKNSFMNKKGQLGMIEFHYFMGGIVVGFIGGLILTYLGTTGVIPFKIPGICPAALKK